MVTGEVTNDTSSEAGQEVTEETPRSTATPVVVWIVYGLGLLAALLLVASLAFVGIAYAASGGDDFGVDVSLPALVVSILLIGAAAGTFSVRRWGGSR
jgi:hypothetical protein